MEEEADPIVAAGQAAAIKANRMFATEIGSNDALDSDEKMGAAIVAAASLYSASIEAVAQCLTGPARELAIDLFDTVVMDAVKKLKGKGH